MVQKKHIAGDRAGTKDRPIPEQHVESLEADQATNTARSPTRDTWSESEVSINVPGDFPTVQEAVDAIAYLPYHEIQINVDSGFDASAEDLLVPQVHAGAGTVSGIGFEHKVRITGDTTSPSNNPLGSLVTAGFDGGYIKVEGFELQNDNPYDNENAVIVGYHSNLQVTDITFADGTNGIIAYGAGAEVSVGQVDFGSNVLSGWAYLVKHGGHLREQAAEGNQSGNVPGYVYQGRVGTMVGNRGSSSVTGDNGLVSDSDWLAGMCYFAQGAGYVSKIIGNYRIGDADNQGEWENRHPGSGWIVTTPDGTDRYRIRVDNSGNVVTDLI